VLLPTPVVALVVVAEESIEGHASIISRVICSPSPLDARAVFLPVESIWP
jgi:hypothetical protein